VPPAVAESDLPEPSQETLNQSVNVLNALGEGSTMVAQRLYEPAAEGAAHLATLAKTLSKSLLTRGKTAAKKLTKQVNALAGSIGVDPPNAAPPAAASAPAAQPASSTVPAATAPAGQTWEVWLSPSGTCSAYPTGAVPALPAGSKPIYTALTQEAAQTAVTACNQATGGATPPATLPPAPPVPVPPPGQVVPAPGNPGGPTCCYLSPSQAAYVLPQYIDLTLPAAWGPAAGNYVGTNGTYNPEASPGCQFVAYLPATGLPVGSGSAYGSPPAGMVSAFILYQYDTQVWSVQLIPQGLQATSPAPTTGEPYSVTLQSGGTAPGGTPLTAQITVFPQDAQPSLCQGTVTAPPPAPPAPSPVYYTPPTPAPVTTGPPANCPPACPDVTLTPVQPVNAADLDLPGAMQYDPAVTSWNGDYMAFLGLDWYSNYDTLADWISGYQSAAFPNVGGPAYVDPTTIPQSAYPAL
jgi:hypothetical protein